MKVTLTLDIPETQLEGELYRSYMTRDEFKRRIKTALSEGLDAEAICPGATCTVETSE